MTGRKRARITAFVLTAALAINIFGAQTVSAANASGSQSVSFSSASQNQSQTVTLPNGAKVISATTNNGNVNYTQSGNQVTVNVSGGTGVTTSYQYVSGSHQETYVSGYTTQQVQTGTTTQQVQTGTQQVWSDTAGTPIYFYGGVGRCSPDGHDWIVGYTGGYVTEPVYTTETVPVYTTETVPVYSSRTVTDYATGYTTTYSYNVTLNYSTDTTPPNGSGTVSTSGWTNQNVTIHFTASDTGSGVASIKTPDGTVVKAASTDYTVSSNGAYSFIVTDKSGNTKTVPVTVSNIDKVAPSGSYTLSKSTWTCKNVVISFTGSDNLSGVAGITLPSGTSVSGASASFTATDNGTYTFTVQDNAGNVTSVPVTVSNIDRSVSVTHPLSASYTVDPNTDIVNADDISITNNNPHIGVAVTLQSLSTSGISDAAPDFVADWKTLSAAQTQSGIAFGVQVKNGWKEIDESSPVYAANIHSPVQLGVINTSSTGNLGLDVKYGLAWSNQTKVSHNLTMLFTATDAN